MVLPSTLFAVVATVFAVSIPGAPDVSGWREILAQLGPIGVVALAALILYSREVRERQRERKEHLEEAKRYHEQELKRSDLLMTLVGQNVAAHEKLVIAIDRLRDEVQEHNGTVHSARSPS